jgi:TP901 family phage tail tape measure protein
MADRKEYEMLFKLTAALGGTFKSTFATAGKSTKELQDTMKALNSTAGDIQKYKNLSAQLEKNKKALAAYTTELADLKKKYDADKISAEEFAEMQDALEGKIAAASKKVKVQGTNLKDLGEKLKTAGVNTSNLTAENEKFTKTYERLATAQKNLKDVQDKLEANKAAISATKTELVKTVGVITGAAAATYMGLVKPAMEYESSMADVAKVVGWINKSGTPTQIKQYKELKQSALDLSTQIPLTAGEITRIMEAAGQSNVAKNNKELIDFTKTAAQMSTAFDVSAEQAGEWMANWRAGLNLTQDEVAALADQINYLGNTSSADAAKLSEVVSRVGALGQGAGLSAGQVAALAASMPGVEPEVAATSIKNFMAALTKGNALTKKGKAVLESMGMSAAGLAERMQDDAQGAILDVLAALKKLPEAEQNAAMTQLFGSESIAGISLMANNTQNLTEQMGKVGDASLYTGSMLEEFAARSDTTANKVELAKNSLSNLAITLGDQLLPLIPPLAEKATELINKVSEFARENPQVVKQVGLLATGLAGIKVAELSGKLGFRELYQGVLKGKEIFDKFNLSRAKTTADTLTGNSTIQNLAKSIGGYFNGIKTASSGVKEAAEKFNFIKTLSGKLNFGGLSKKLLAPIKSISGRILGSLSSGLSKVTGIFGKLGSAISKGPLGKIGRIFGNMGKTIGAVVSGPLKLLGGGFGGLFGKVMPIIAIVSLLAAAFVKLSGGDISAFIEPLKKAFEDAKPTLESVMNQFKGLAENIMPLLMDAAAQLMPLFSRLVQGILPIIMEVIEQLTPILISIIKSILPVILSIMTQLMPVLTNVITSILPVILQLVQTLLPIITKLVTSVMPIIADALNEILPIASQLITTLSSLLMPILQDLIPVIQVLAEMFSGVLDTAIKSVKPILDGLVTILGGIIGFITGAFTGDWSKAWDGIKSIFKGIWDSIEVAANVGEGIKNAWGKVTTWFKETWEKIASFFSEVWEKIKAPFVAAATWFDKTVIHPIVRIFAPIVQKIGEIFSTLWQIVVALFTVAAQWFNTNVIQPIISVFSTVVGAVSGFFSETWNRIVAVFMVVSEWFNVNVVQPLINIFAQVASTLGGFFSAAWENIKSVFSTVGEFFTGIWETIKGIFTSIGTAIGDVFSNAFKSVVNAILTFAENRINGFINAINTVVGIVNKLPGVSIKTIAPLSIPKLAKGSNFTPDTFIAGEHGAELVTGAAGRKVFTALQTQRILNNAQAAFNPPPALSSQAITNSRNISRGGLTFSYTANVSINGSASQADVEGALAKDKESFEARMENWWRRKQDDERRMAYA